jgi:hypothetical protein
MRRYDGELPSYVREMDEYAVHAGLTIRRLDDRHREYLCNVILVYSGTREQIARCGLFGSPESISWPTTNKARLLDVVRLAPLRGYRGHLFRLAEPLYALQLEVELPRAISRPCEGVECFDFRYAGWNRVAYVGEKSALIAANIVKPEMLPDDAEVGEGEEASGVDDAYVTSRRLTLIETILLHNRRWAVVKYPNSISRAEELRQERAPNERRLLEQEAAETPEAWKASHAQSIIGMINSALKGLGGDGAKRISTADRQRIIQLRDQMNSVILNAQVITTARGVLRLVK